MIHHVWSALCQNASIDIQTNSVSLFNVLEGITLIGSISEEKRGIIRLELVSLWNRESEDIPCKGLFRMHFIDPKGKDSEPFSLEINLMESFFHRTRISIPNMAIAYAGQYNCIIEYQDQGENEWHQVAKIPLIITILPSQATKK
jgi:hypothetical protein